jgi:multiple sugar transport system substrate-binding protein
MFQQWLCITLVVLVSVATPSWAQDQFNWKKFSGETISIALAKQPWSDFIAPKIPEFEQLTGIKVRLEVLPEDQNRQKLAIAFVSNRGDIDIFGSQRHQEGAKYHAAKWYEPLKPYIDNRTITSPTFDFADFAPQAVNDATVGGELIGIPLYSELQVLAYRKDLLQQAGLKVPETLEELEAAAKQLTDKQKGIYGICLRGKGAATTTIYSGILHSMGGSWVDGNGSPAFTTPEALKAFNYYGRLAREYGPPGGVNNNWLQCQSLMAAGGAAFWTDSNIFFATLVDPTKSSVADRFGFAMLPAGPGGRKPAGGGWYLSMYSKSKHKGPAWYFIQWAISKENALKAQLTAIPTARLSAWESADFKKNDKAPELTKATLDSLKLKNTPSWGPPFVAVGEVRDVLGAVVVTAIQGGDIKAAAEKADGQIQDIRKKTGG